ncbi:YcdB/YcdC domain-containing protein [Thermoanaerobacterium sp. DL9XJH110]|uniref:YcdB/YcdC domain-containing protein n=1 Tax=Thermoanaerobacterium sp. DL9XJH110 TaxID=3386643 RepID=UPI003BB5FE5D
MKKIRCIAALILVVVFSFSVFVPATSAQASAAFSQEEAIDMVKSLFDTSVYDKFTINYNEGKDQKIWNLNWSRSKEPYGSLSVTVDADKGHILNLYMYKGPDKKPSLLPRLSEEEARRKAEEFARKVQPEEFAKTRYIEREEPIYRPMETIRYRREYYFNFVRVENDIPVEGDGFNITVDAGSGDILSYNFNWSYDKLPSAGNIISVEQAEKVFKDKVGLKLIYQRFFDYESRQDAVKLVYTVDGPSRVLIDATSGELITEGYYDGPYYGDLGGGGEFMKSPQRVALTPQEQKEVEATKNCISKDAAVRAVQKYLKIPEGYEQNYANLYEDYENPERKVWNIGWDKKPTSQGDYGSIHAQVDAVSSELLSFNIYDDSRYRGELKQNYDRDAARKKAEEFLKKIQPGRFEEVKLEEPRGEMNLEKVREHYFNFVRQVNGIPYPANGFSVGVDPAGGGIISYSMRWQEREFPKADGVLSKEEAENMFLKDVGLELSYVRVYRPEEQSGQYYLAYKLKPAPSSNFDAYDLKPLDYRGNPIEKKTQTAFTDIQGHWAEKDIKLLVDIGVIEPKEDRFRPDEDITQGDFLKLLMIATNRLTQIDEIALKFGATASEKDTDAKDEIQKYIEAAIKMGLVKKGEVDAEKPLSREQMAAFLIRTLDFEKVASIPGIYNVPAKDAAAVAPEYRGHVAIAMGLKLVTGSGGNFDPKGKVTRAQAATVLVRMLNIEK